MGVRLCAISADNKRNSMHRVVSLATSAILLASPLSSAAQQQTATGATRTPSVRPNATGRAVKMLPGTRGNVLTTIQGNALTSTNGPLPDSVVRLRDARFGRIVDTELTHRPVLCTTFITDRRGARPAPACRLCARARGASSRSARRALSLPPSVRHRLRARDDGDDYPGLYQRPDVSGAGTAAHRRRAVDGGARP